MIFLLMSVDKTTVYMCALIVILFTTAFYVDSNNLPLQSFLVQNVNFFHFIKGVLV